MFGRRLMLAALALVVVVGIAGMDVFAKKPPKDNPPSGPPPGADPAICYRPANGTQVWAMDDDGSNRYQVSTVSHFLASWSPDGQHIVFDRGPGELWCVDWDGENEYLLVDDGSEPAWSPSGDVIAYAGNDWTTLEVIPAEGGDPETLFTASGDNWITTPTWNAAGTHIAFHENDDSGYGPVYVIELETGEKETIATLETWHIRWARTDNVLLYQNDAEGGIYTFDMDTDTSAFVTDGKRPCWSPDDSQFVFEGSVEVQGRGKKTRTKSGLIKYTIASGDKTFLFAGSFGDWRR